MSNKTMSGLSGFACALLCITLTACNSTPHLFVKQSDLVALDQCLANQQSQQQLFARQQAQHEETVDLLNANLEEQKRLAALIPPPQIEKQRTVVCPPVRPRPLRRTNANDNIFQEKQLVGETEQVLLNGLDILLKARIDTGSVTASLDARNIQTFERNGEDWVRFTVYNPETRAPIEVERKRVRNAHIVQSGAEDAERRPVVEMRITVGKITQNAEFTLVDRSNLEFPVLIGRNILRDVMLVDVSHSNMAPPLREVKKEEVKKPAQPAQAKPAQTTPATKTKPAAAPLPVAPKAEPKVESKVEPKVAPEPKTEPKTEPTAPPAQTSSSAVEPAGQVRTATSSSTGSSSASVNSGDRTNP